MKICFVTHKVRKGDGQGRVNYEVILEALRQGHEVMIIASELSEDLARHPRVEWRRVSAGRVPTELLRNQLFAIRTTFELLARKRQLDLIVVNGFVTYARSDINCIHFVHSAWLASRYHPFRERKSLSSLYQWVYTGLNRYLEQHAMKRTSVVVAVSERIRQELIRDAGIGGERIAVIWNGVDLQEFYPERATRAELQLEDDKLYALFAGDIKSSRKNLDTVLKALSNIQDVHLLVVGGTEGSPYPKMAAELGIGSRVRFLGYRTNMADWMSVSDMFVYPSRYEPFALVLLEALAAGTPVIASRICGAADLFADEFAVGIDDPDDTEALTEAIRNLAADRERLRRMGTDARNAALQHSWSGMAALYVSLMEQAAVRKSVPLVES
ncbi:glycosyltransferase family 4 protein [Paenibacillus sp. BK720]|uniref:glycosyltransferase family 4 protein n=1 Tax=Paenibacillus sp. BK720 TaxID=2587092 RepID=UPI00141E4DD3|nr:glycosyltransferase family 4 protein [Paenibacillus sp. BK720]NIK66659.1 glycosyltransferase involved in cell wall biosynthesis [Paenibacillus sp. BK720]